MKYIISETRLRKVLREYMLEYLDFVARTNVEYESDPFKIIEEPSRGDDVAFQYMEYDRTDGRLWINKEFLSIFNHTFPFAKDFSKDFIKEWFENRYGVEIKFVESPS